MFFSGDSSTRKRVDLGGRSSKERDRKKLLEQTRLERERRMQVRAQNSAAIKIQKWFRGKRALQADRLRVRDQFFSTYGNHFEKVNRHCFSQESDFLRQLLYFVSPLNAADFSALLETCRILRRIVRDSGDILSIFSGDDYSSKHGVVDYRVKQFAYTCIRAIHQNRNQLKDQIFLTLDQASMPTVLLFGTVIMLIDPRLPWSCKIVGYLLKRNTYALLREIIFTGKESRRIDDPDGNISSLGSLLALFLSHVGQNSCVCPNIDPRWSFSSQILTIPFLWKLFPHLKEALATKEMSEHYIHQMALCVKNHANVLPSDISAEFPSYACLLANLLETTGVTLSRSDCSFDMAIDFAAVATFLLEALPPMHSSYGESKEDSMMDEDGITTSNQVKERNLSMLLQEHISKAIDPKFLLQLTNTIFRGIPLINSTSKEEPRKTEVTAIGAACAFLHVTFNILPRERVMTVLAYRTELVPVLWNFMKQCHENQKWSDLSIQFSYAQGDAPGWLLPLSVFCPVYKHMLMIVDNEEFYDQEKPLSLNDIKCLIAILRQALWQLLWVNPGTPPDLSKSTSDVFDLKRHPREFLQHRVSIVASDLLSQLQDWNNRKQFTLPTDFHADGVNDHFISQASVENTKAREILKHAPFLVPFTSRVKIFTTQLGSARHSDGNHMAYTRTRFRIRRDHILEDAFSQWSTLSEEGLRGPIRVTFVNEYGVEEAGIDGGGIFKDFMENITRAAFDMQYGLFKETSDHLLYPNPGSGIIHELHLQFFHFLGTILGKAMFEGILVDIPFATFFLSKLKKKYNYLNDLPSLDPELYRHLIFLKRYEGDISELELYFVIVNNEYGEQIEEELLPGGKNIRVTNENVITFIHLIANHRLNFQIRQQSSHFLRGFQQLVPTDWIDMFNEHELQLLISGSLDGFDLEDLRVHTNYSGGYHSEHYVIDMFWDVLKSLSMDSQMKFLKFVTGCSRGPLLGFKHLEPTFCIQRAAGSASEEALDRLPTSATCMNLLKLPPYRSKEQLKQKLMYAIDAEAGFDLS